MMETPRQRKTVDGTFSSSGSDTYLGYNQFLRMISSTQGVELITHTVLHNKIEGCRSYVPFWLHGEAGADLCPDIR
jgi:hypothetical protein